MPGGPRQISEEIGKAVPLYRTVGRGGFWGADLLEKSFMTPSGKGRFAAFDVDVTPHSGEKVRYLFDENYFLLNIRRRVTA